MEHAPAVRRGSSSSTSAAARPTSRSSRRSSAARTLALERVAVGDHLLLGGDNMDIALGAARGRPVSARAQAPRQACAGRNSCWQCRIAKEMLLGGAVETATVQLAGRGRGVVGGALSETVTRADVEELVLEGFFPLVAADARPRAARGAGLREWGLPFASESEIPRRLALSRASSRDDRRRRCVLYNGGVFTRAALRERMTAVLRGVAPPAGPTAPGGFSCRSTSMPRSRAAPRTTRSPPRRGACASRPAARGRAT